ncbi:MAG: hypothetical protein F4Y97_08005 [Dehalococcoidia bacterium]|nr:hypothetical protein [Dehalococcoidia bacterium]
MIVIFTPNPSGGVSRIADTCKWLVVGDRWSVHPPPNSQQPTANSQQPTANSQQPRAPLAGNLFPPPAFLGLSRTVSLSWRDAPCVGKVGD